MASNNNPFGLDLYSGGGATGSGSIPGVMGMLGGGGGLFGLGDLATGGLFSFGSGLLGGLGSLFGGKSDSEKRADKVFSLAQNRLGQDVLNPDQYLADYMRTMAPKFNMQGETMNRRLGLDSGVAQGELAHMMDSELAGFLLNAKMQNDQLKSQRDDSLMNLMAMLGRG